MFVSRRFSRFRPASIRFFCAGVIFAKALGLAFSQCRYAGAQEDIWTISQSVSVNFAIEPDWATGNSGRWTLNSLADYELRVTGQDSEESSALQTVIAKLIRHHAEWRKWDYGEKVNSIRAIQDVHFGAGARNEPYPLSYRIHLDSEIAKRVFYYDDDRIGGYIAVFGEASTKNQPSIPTFAGDLTYSGAVSLVDWNWILQLKPSVPKDDETTFSEPVQNAKENVEGWKTLPSEQN